MQVNQNSPLIVNLTALVAVLFCALLLSIAGRGVPRTKGRDIKFHLIYALFPVVLILTLPLIAKDILFSPLTVVVVGTAFPIYESLRAACSVVGGDDTTWLSYWIVQGIVSFSTEWVDNMSPQIQIHWNMFEFFFYLWLCLPWTDGATLMFDFFITPVVAPIVQPIVQKVEGVINKIISVVMNAAHLSIVWIVFEFLPPTAKRVVWILLATVYPLLSSMVSVTTVDGGDDTFWLTYWSCFGILFVITDLLENWLGFIPGFYTLAIALTVYLMLPIFKGAEQIFRNVLVPIAGLQELLVRRDAELVKRSALKDLPPETRALILKEIGESFQRDAAQYEKKQGYQAVDDNSEVV